MLYNTLVLSGGGVKGILTLGAIQYAIDNHLIDNITTYVGVSVGSMISFLLTIGYSPIEILVFIITHKIFDKLKDLNLNSIVNWSGIFEYSKINEELEIMTIEKIGFLPTMKDIKNKFGKDLRMITYNESLVEQEIITYETHPDLPCLIAIRMSSNLPFVFSKFSYGGNFYLDGGMVNNFPIDIVDNDSNKILGFVICGNGNEDKSIATVGTIQYLINTIYIPIRYNTEKNIRKSSKSCDIIRLSSMSNMLNFNISSVEKLNMFVTGWNITKTYYENKSK